MSIEKKYHKSWRDVIRTAILLRDSCRCFICKNQSTSNHVHHCDNNPSNNLPFNLVCVCPQCHLLLSRNRARIILSDSYVFTPHQTVFNNALLDFLQLADKPQADNVCLDFPRVKILGQRPK